MAAVGLGRRRAATRTGRPGTLAKSRTGIPGLDDVAGGGLPTGRPTLVCGASGSGKTLLGAQFLVRGATEYGEPGVFITFEETAEEIAANVRSLGFDLDALTAQRKLLVDHVRVERSEIQEAGEYDLEALFIRLGHAIDAISASRVVLDTIESLFGGLHNEAILRAELRRLFRWLKTKGATAVVTAESGGDGALTRWGLEEYLSDCVILLDHRVHDEVSTRRLRIVKYRGAAHGTNEYPFLIDERGISVVPVTSLGLQHEASTDRISTGIPGLDAMLGSGGYFRGSTVLVSGTAGTGKTTVAAHFVDAACRRGERCLFFAFEESPRQIVRNMRSVGFELERWMKKGLLRIEATRPALFGLERHLAAIHQAVTEYRPRVVVVEPITNFGTVGSHAEVGAMLMRLVDFLKSQRITALFTSLSEGGAHVEHTETAVSSLVDTWVMLRDVEFAGERNLVLQVRKSRGMAHSNQLREFLITSHGIEVVATYLGPEGVLTGSARLTQVAREGAAALARQQETDRLGRTLARKRRLLETRVASLRLEFEAEEEEIRREIEGGEAHERQVAADRTAMARSRQTNAVTGRGDCRRRTKGRAVRT